jgi:hypothetical protein
VVSDPATFLIRLPSPVVFTYPGPRPPCPDPAASATGLMVLDVEDTAVPQCVLGHIARRVELILFAGLIGDSVRAGADGWIRSDQALGYPSRSGLFLPRPPAPDTQHRPLRPLLLPIRRRMVVLRFGHRSQAIHIVVGIDLFGNESGRASERGRGDPLRRDVAVVTGTSVLVI